MKNEKINIIYKNVNDLIPYDKNPRRNDKAVDKVANSIREFGFKVPIVIDENNVIICGHTRLKAAKKLGLQEVPVIIANDLTDAQIRAFRIADNKVGELAEWDESLLASELEFCDIDMLQFGFEDNPETKLDSDKYTSLGEMVQYEPKTECPSISELVNEEKKNELLQKIEESNVDEETKIFLKKAATRHDCFNYAKIAEFYCHQNKEVQELMEESGLVIIDFNEAIKNGFVSLTGSLKDLAEDLENE